MTDEHPDPFLEGIRLFNEEEFYECHDVLEELWSETLGPEKKFLQGLIQASVALFHFGNGNIGGAIKLYRSARANLEPYDSPCMGIDLAKFTSEFQFCFQELLDSTEEYPSHIELRDERVPKVAFVAQDE